MYQIQHSTFVSHSEHQMNSSAMVTRQPRSASSHVQAMLGSGGSPKPQTQVDSHRQGIEGGALLQWQRTYGNRHVQKTVNDGYSNKVTGIPTQLRTGLEKLSGLSFDDVKVHYNSARPLQYNALAYTQGAEIHLAPGQEQHLPHEVWHVVQQKQGRVRPTFRRAGVAINDDVRLEKEATQIGSRAQSMGAQLVPSQTFSHQSSINAHQHNGHLLNTATTQPIQRVKFAKMRTTLIAGSNQRKTNPAYNAILGDLQQAALDEQVAVTAQDFTNLGNRITTILGQIPQAHSKQAVRNNALTALTHSLTQKQQDLQQQILADQPDGVTKHKVKSGPKAGFEIEFNNVLILDPSRATPYVRKYLNGHISQEPNKKALSSLGYPKRKVLFTAPNGTWEGQADTTLDLCSNLEIVTKPLTAKAWLARQGAAAKDQAALTTFITNLQAEPRKRLLLPKQVLDNLQLNQAGARLFKLDTEATSQMQMTAAMPVPRNQTAEPDWWIKGLNWDAMPYLQHIVDALQTTSFGIQSNPKSAAFMKDGKNVILKTPILALLGKPTAKVKRDAKQRWVIGVAKLCGVEDLSQSAGEELVRTSQGSPAHMHLQGTNFTWQQYFADLLVGKDRVTQWAKTAFGGTEDIGLGQISDSSLGPDYAIEEHRELAGHDNYLIRARRWANNRTI